MTAGYRTTEVRRFGLWGVGAVVGVLLLLSSFFVFERVDANEIVLFQSPLAGKLTWHTSAGLKVQWFSKVTRYRKRDIFEVQVPVRFNDGGHGTLHGSIQYELPMDAENLTQLHVAFGSREAIEQQLIQTVANKSVYLTGPLMSSKESYAERRNDLIHFVEDQVQNGVYQTRSRETKVNDPITGVEKTAVLVEIVRAPNGQPERQEQSVLNTFGIKTFNFAIDSLPYDAAVEAQIQQQQKLAMQVQTAIASAREAEQRAITAQKDGEANAAKARWAQEVERATAVTLAQQELDVARLERQTAEQYKQAEILRGEGEGARRRLAMQADGALQQKLTAWLEAQKVWAAAVSAYQGAWVPNVVMGGQPSGGNGANALIDMLTAKTARDLGLDLQTAKK